jgi:hypothetical protein
MHHTERGLVRFPERQRSSRGAEESEEMEDVITNLLGQIYPLKSQGGNQLSICRRYGTATAREPNKKCL